MRLLVGCCLMICATQALVGAVAAAPAEGPLLERVIALNRIIEPELDGQKLRSDVMALCAEARAAVATATTAAETIAALNKVLLENRKVTYLSNVYWRDSTLASCVERRGGNCMSTSTLYAVVGDILGLPIHLVMLPNHAFVRWDGDDIHINIETTNPGVDYPDSYYLKTIDSEDRESLRWGASLDGNGLIGVLSGGAARHCISLGNLVEAQRYEEEFRKLLPWRVDLVIEQIVTASDLTKDRESTRTQLNEMLKGHQPPSVATSALLWLADDAGARRKPYEQRNLLMRAYQIAPREDQGLVLDRLAFCHRALRDHSAALLYYELELNQPSLGDPNSERNLYCLAILLKETKRLSLAQANIDKALVANPESWNSKVLKAGYLCHAGHVDEGKALFATIEKPRDEISFWLDMQAWFFAVSGQKAEFYKAFAEALRVSDSEHILLWIEQDEDLDQFRNEPEFRTLVDEQRARILGEKPKAGTL
jgi:tetratricopeptide (TPR) repeat protein